jgi:hypothetical protein
MTLREPIVLQRLRADEGGAALVEFALVMLLFFFLFFSLIDFGRWGSSYVLAEKATQLAARTAAVRPPACAGVPERHERPAAPSANPPRFGTSCRAASNPCATAATVSCPGLAGNPSADEIWARIQPLLPPDATIGNLRFEYRFDPNLGFLGGPYTPLVTVEITPPNFQFISPLGAMAAALGGGGGGGLGAAQPYGGFSVSLPAEDLANGENG